MVAGMERYYQIARCYRDEDFRADRQPEFTQLDIEMSFVEQDDILALGEEIAVALWKLIGVDIPTPLPRLTYAEAMARFGTDKPDTRFGQELVDCTAYFADTAFRVFQADYVGAVVMPGGASQPRKTLDAWQEFAKQRGARGLAYVLVQEDGELGGPVAKNLSDAERAGLAAHVGAAPGDCVFFAAGVTKASRALLGAVRLEIAKRSGAQVVWVGPPRTKADASNPASLNKFDEEMKAAIGPYGSYVSSAPFTPNYDGPDGIHDNSGTAKKWAQGVFGALTQ